MPTGKSKKIKISPRQLAKDSVSDAEILASIVGGEPSIDRLVAQHPNTDEDTLRKLASSKDKTTRKYVAANPRTPHDVIFKLANQFPQQFLNNPSLDLILLEHPQLLDAFTPRFICGLIKREYCPVFFLEAVADTTDKGVVLALLMNPETSRSAIKKVMGNCITWNIAREAELHVNSLVVGGGNWYGEFRKHVLEDHWYTGRNINELKLFLAGSYPHWIKQAIVRNLPGEVVYGLAGNKEVAWDVMQILVECRETDATAYSTRKCVGWDQDWVMSLIASNPATPVKVIEELVNELPDYSAVMNSIAKNPNTPLVVLERLANNSDTDVHYDVACNVNTPPELVEQILKNTDWETIEAIFTNTEIKIPPNVLERLATYTDTNGLEYLMSFRRAFVARHPHTTGVTLARLSMYEDEDIHDAILTNPNTPPEVLERLFNEGDYGSASNPSIPIKYLEQCATSINDWMRISAVRNPKTPSHLLEILSHDEDLVADVAENPNISITLLGKLAAHKAEGVRGGVAENPSAPVDILEQLVRDKSVYVRVFVAENPNIPVALIEQLAKDSSMQVREVIAGRSELSKAILEGLVDDSSRKIRVIIAGRKGLPTKVLEQLAQDKHAIVRSAVAGNTETPLLLLRSLMLDKNKDVRRAVAGNTETPLSLLRSLMLVYCNE